ncbi:MAG: S8 family serine peptidase [candidate division WOR-3 bacterium]|jgi:subtilisin family serine protease
MKRFLVLCIFLGFVPAFALLSPDLAMIIEQKEVSELIPVDIVLEEQIDVRLLKAEVARLSKAQKRARVAEILRSFSAVHQARLLEYLESMERQGKVSDIKSLWIHNGVYCRATKDVIMAVHLRKDVEYVDYDLKPMELPKPEHAAAAPDVTREIAWGVLKVRAEQVWSLGFTGHGVVVGVIDTGVNYNHVDLAGHMWTDPNYPNHGWNFEFNNNDPMDVSGHGTHCAGSIASDGTAGSQCGVAPEAQIMACRVRTVADSVAEEQVFSAMQFVVSPPASPTNGGDLISMSLGWQYQWGPRRATWRQSCDNVGAAGIVMCIAAGNERTSNTPPNAVRCPGDVPPPWQNPENGAAGALSAVVTVGATDINDLIGSFSSPGPVTWQSISPYNDYAYPPGLTCPDVSAPGVNIKSCAYNNNTGYVDGWNGTSMATPHTAGVVALMLEKNPDLTLLEIDSILETTAIDLGVAGKDNDFGAGRIDALFAVNATPEAGAPETPSIISPFEYAKLCTQTPTLRFMTNDPQSDDVMYRVYWDTDTSFSSPDSTTTGTYPSGAVASFVFPVSLTDGMTYWWQVRSADTTSSGSWSGLSEWRSFTIDTALPSNSCSWFQTTGAQFTGDGFFGTEIQGDSVILLPLGYVEDTLLFEDFETAGIPAGWTVVDGNSDGVQWTVGTTGDLSSYTPPSYGVQYAYYSDDDAGSGTINYNEELISPARNVPGSASNLSIEYGYGFRQYQSGEILDVRVRFFNGSWGSWTTIASYTSSANGTEAIDLTPYLPADSVQFDWMYHDETSSSHWGWAGACDNIVVTYSYTFTNDQGTLTGTPVAHSDLSAVYGRPHWGQALWRKASSGDSIGIQVEYFNGSWQQVPDMDLPGNSTGFFTSTENGSITLSSLDTLTYGTLRLLGIFQRINDESPNNPALLDWELGNLAGGETVPPEPFSLVSPADSAIFSNPRPAFVWHSTYDTGSGLQGYRVYIGGQLRHTTTDTSWTADYDLPEGYSSWYVAAYDSANNSRNSNETWYVGVDITPPAAVVLVSPSDNCYLNNGNVNFVWHESNDNLSGVQHYTLQYALNSAFTQGLVETTCVDTTFTVTLADTIYYWRVKATDAVSNEGTFSPVWQFEIDTQMPAAPTLVAPVGGGWLNDASVNLQWSTVTAIVGGHNQSPDFRAPIRYVLQIDVTTNFTSPVYVDTLSSAMTTVSMVENFYYWRVMAYDLAGNQGQYSTIDSFGVDVSGPSTVSLIQPSNNGYLNNSTVNFTWHNATDNLSGVNQYIVQYALNSAFTQGLVETTMVDTTFTHILAETTYYWHVMAVDAANNSGSFSATWQFEIDTQSPSIPNLVTPTGGIWHSDTVLDFEWSPVTNIVNTGQGMSAVHDGEAPAIPLSPVQYVIEIDTSALFSTPLFIDTCASTTLPVVLGENFYFWRVRAFDMAGNQGQYSDHDSVGVDVSPPQIDSTTVWDDTTFVGPFEVMTCVYDDLSGTDSVLLHYKRDQDPTWVCVTMHGVAADWYVDTIPAVSGSNDSVRYYVEAVDMAQPGNQAFDPAGAPANYYGFLINLTGIDEVIAERAGFRFSIGQNPARDRVVLSVSMPASAAVEMRVYDVSGRMIGMPVSGYLPAGNHIIDWIPKVSNGIYFYTLESPWEHRSGKIILVK